MDGTLVPQVASLHFIDGEAYALLRERVRAGDSRAASWAVQLRASAEALCEGEPPAVTDKVFTPDSPSRDPHDYVSIAPYWWPNPDTPDGLPYIHRDGRRSPEIARYDRPRWERASEGATALARAAFCLDATRFAQAAAAWLRRWFLDADTRMNPHLAHAQFIPGRETGRMYGIIEFSLALPPLLDHVRLLARLERSPWTGEDRAGFGEWCRRFLDWCDTHPFGRAEEATTNNHAVYYDRLIVALALFLDHPERARAQLEKTRARVAQQIEPDGRMPRELARTRSFSYTLMNTRGFVDLAHVGRTLGVDLWAWTAADGRGIRAAVEFLYRFACSREPWAHEQLDPIDWRLVWPVLQKAGALEGRPYDYAPLAHRMPRDFDPAG